MDEYDEDYNRFEDPRHIAWARAVKERDGFTCQVCDATECYLHSHHMDSWDLSEEGRFDVHNGICLCSDCHMRFHRTYGYQKNTRYQFEEFEKFVQLIKQAVSKEIDSSSS